MKNLKDLSIYVIARSKATKQSAVSLAQWIATLPSVARNDVNRAFTLAEVLITLTIIGVIAAITIPNLMQNYKKHQAAAKIKQTYSKLQTVMQLAVSDTSLKPEYWLPQEYQSASTNDKRDYIYNNYFKPYMKTKKWDKTTGVFYDDSGIKYTITSWPMQSKNTHTADLGHISFNINGNKSNIAGKDVFYMVYQYKDAPYRWWNSGKSKMGQLLAFEPCGFGRNLEQDKAMSFDPNSGAYPSCKPLSESSSYRTCCGDIIMRSGWEIPDDYPIKF